MGCKRPSSRRPVWVEAGKRCLFRMTKARAAPERTVLVFGLVTMHPPLRQKQAFRACIFHNLVNPAERGISAVVGLLGYAALSGLCSTGRHPSCRVDRIGEIFHYRGIGQTAQESRLSEDLGSADPGAQQHFPAFHHRRVDEQR